MNITRRFKLGSLALSSLFVDHGTVFIRKERLYPSSLVSFFFRLKKTICIISRAFCLSLGSCITYWWWCRRVNWSHYKPVLPKRKKRSTRTNIVWGVSASLVVLLGLAAWKIKGGKERTMSYFLELL